MAINISKKQMTEEDIKLNFITPALQKRGWQDSITMETKGLSENERKIINEPFYTSQTTYAPRYYQRVAVNRTVSEVAKGKDRILLVMATGTGKTYTAFQIVHRLLKSGLKKKVLYLADRNILVDQTIAQDFSPLSKVIHKINFQKDDRTTITSYQVYFSLYQQLADREYDNQNNSEEDEESYMRLKSLFDKDYFDLIIVDEYNILDSNKTQLNSKPYLIPFGSRLKVTDGQEVEAGDPLTEGSVDPHDILNIQGLRKVQDYLLKEVQKVYRLQGVEINDKHIEMIVRQMLRKVLISDAGDSKFLPDTTVDIVDFEQENEKLIEQGKKPAVCQKARNGEYIPEIKGITKASLTTDSFLSAASFQETTRVLTEASINGKIDCLEGLKENVIIGRTIPTGTGMKRYQNTFISTDIENNDVKADDMRYVIKETDDLEDILSYVRAINFKNVKAYTKDELKDNKDLEDKFWQDVIDNTEYIRIPKGYVDGFKLRKFLSVEYVYKNYINGSPSIPWGKECEYVFEFFEKRIFERIGI